MVAADTEMDVLVYINAVFPREDAFPDTLIRSIQTGVVEIEQVAHGQLLPHRPAAVLQPPLEDGDDRTIADEVDKHRLPSVPLVLATSGLVLGNERLQPELPDRLYLQPVEHGGAAELPLQLSGMPLVFRETGFMPQVSPVRLFERPGHLAGEDTETAVQLPGKPAYHLSIGAVEQ